MFVGRFAGLRKAFHKIRLCGIVHLASRSLLSQGTGASEELIFIDTIIHGDGEYFDITID